MTIGEVARICGIGQSAIRYYEQAGLLPKPLRRSGRRVYDTAALDRIAFVQFARLAGFTIAEIKILSERTGPDKPLSARFRRMAAEKVEEIDRLIERANAMKGLLAKALLCRCIDVEQCGRRIRQAARNDATRR